MQEAKNIHRILNELDEAFGRKRLSVQVSHIANGHIYLAVTYVKDALITEEGLWKKPQSMLTSLDPRPGDRKDLKVMLKLWIKETTRKDVCGNRLEQPTYSAVLWNDGIYVNEYVMPDKDLARQFYEARRKMAGCMANLMAGSTEVVLSGRLLREAVSRTETMITSLSEDMIKLMDGKRHILPYVSGASFREQLLDCRRSLDQAVRVYDYLKHGIASGETRRHKTA